MTRRGSSLAADRRPAVFLVLAVVVYVAVRLEARYALFRALSAALVGILIAMILSNVGILPDNSPAYDFLSGPGVSLGIALILLSGPAQVILRAEETAAPADVGMFM